MSGHGRHELDGVGLDAGVQRGPERGPHPERDREPAVRVGPQHQRQDRHQLGVDGDQRHRRPVDPQLRVAEPAGHDGGDLVLGRGEHRALLGLDQPGRRVGERRAPHEGDDDDDHEPGRDDRPGRPERRADRARPGEQVRADDDVDDREDGEGRGRPDQRDDEEREHERRHDRARRVDGEQGAGGRSLGPRLVAEQRGRRREREAHDDRGRQDDEGRGPGEVPQRVHELRPRRR